MQSETTWRGATHRSGVKEPPIDSGDASASAFSPPLQPLVETKTRFAYSFPAFKRGRLKLGAFCALTLALSMPVAAFAAAAAASPATVTAALVTPSPAPVASADPAIPPAPLCFEGEPDYAYVDERLWVNIRKRESSIPSLTYFVCDVQTIDPDALSTALSDDKPGGNHEITSDIAKRHDAVLAINGDCYDFHSSGIIIRNGEVLRRKKVSNRHMLTLDKRGDLVAIAGRGQDPPAELAQELLDGGVVQTWEFGPELVRDGQAVDLKPFGLIPVRDNLREPRTAIGQIGPLHYVIIVVDGRDQGHSKGISLPDLQQLFLEAGAQTAFNLDGGGSTTLYFNGEVINRPSAGHQRAVSDILLFK